MKKNSVVFASIASFGMRILQAALGFVNSIIIARLVGAEGVGVFASTVAVLTLFTIPIELGISRLAPREISRAMARGEPAKTRAFFDWGWGLVLRGSILVCALYLARLLILPEVPSQAYMMALLMVTVPGFAAATFAAGILRGFKRVVSGQSLQAARNIIFLAFLGGMLLLPEVSVLQVLLAQAAAVIVSSAAVIVLSRKALPEPSGDDTDNPPVCVKEWRQALIPFAIISGIGTIAMNLNVIMVKWLHGAAEAGIYQVALQFGNIAIFGLTAMAMTLAPYFAESMARGQHETTQRLARKSALAATALAGSTLLCFWGFGQGMLDTLYGKEFSSAYGTLILISVAQLINASTGNSMVILQMSGHEKVFLRILIAGTAVNLLVNALLIPSLGAAGGAWGLVATNLVSNIYAWVVIRRKLSIETFVLLQHRTRPIH